MSGISEAMWLDRIVALESSRFLLFTFPEPWPLAFKGPASLIPLALAEAVWLFAKFLALLYLRDHVG